MEFGDRLESMWAYIVAYLPQLLGAILILIVGWIVAKLLEQGTEAILEKTRFDMAVDRGGVRAAGDRLCDGCGGGAVSSGDPQPAALGALAGAAAREWRLGAMAVSRCRACRRCRE